MSEPVVSKPKYYVRNRNLTIFHQYFNYKEPGGSWRHIQFVIMTKDRKAGLDKMAEILQKEWSGANTLWDALEGCKVGKASRYFSFVLV